jgi:protein-disulfide isomerase-like protein with CxxC motif
MAPITVTHLSDPGCPFAYSAAPALTALQWRYGDQLAWRHVMIGLTEHAQQYAERGYTRLRMATGQKAFRRFGMPFGRLPKESLSGTGRACRAVVAVRLMRPDLEWSAFRALQLTQFTTPLPIESDEAILQAMQRLPGVPAEEILAAVDADEVHEAYERDREEARTAAGTPTEFQGKAADTDGAVRYTAPSLVFTTEDGRSLEAGGFQSLEAYDVCIANLDTTLARRGAPSDLGDLLDAFPHGLATAEVAAVLAPMPPFTDEDAAEDALLALVDAGRAVAEHVGDGAMWFAASSPYGRAVTDRRARLGAPLRPSAA